MLIFYFSFFQSLVERLHLNAEDISIQPVHPSIIGQDTWFQITYNSSGTTRYFSCQSTKERDEWIQSLKKTLMLTEDRRRTDNSLKLGVLEVKGLSDKKKYFVEVHIDDKLYARTSSKKLCGMCFWGEHFEFKDLPPRTDRINLLIHKDKGNRKKPKKPVGRVKISISSIQSRYMQEKWHTVEKSSRRESPSLRLKCQFQSIDILPLRDYEEFLYFLKDEYKSLCKMLEPVISVKVKEELSFSLMSVFHSQEIAEDVLAEIVVDEISSIENEHLTFRGNSIATKAMEAYIKLVGQKYLQDTLQGVVREILSSELDLEVDPIKVTNPEALSLHRQNLKTVVKSVWSRISKSYSYFPITLQRCFFKIRQFLQHVGKPDIAENLISSCIFLRYLCPAILSPSLFHLTDEYPNERANRNLTLIAKTLQTLANFTRYEGKENSMEFLNPFLEEEGVPMKTFLHQISSPLAEDGWIPNLNTPMEQSDLGKHLSCLHTILFENVSKITIDNATSARLRQILDDINSILHRPTIPQLEQISQPTMKTLEKLQSTEKSSSGITLPWSWTLPKKNKNGENRNPSFSHPAPHHEAPKTNHFFVSSNDGITLSSDTSSSASLTPSPGSQIKDPRRSWANGPTPSGGVRIPKSSHDGSIMKSRGRPNSKLLSSSMSLDDTDSSDDSTYSSQYQSDATSTPRCISHTLPRPPTGGAMKRGSGVQNNAKSLSDYETEILELRSAMESLQTKLMEAERKLKNQEISATGVGTSSSSTSPEPSGAEMNMLPLAQNRKEENVKEVISRLLSEEDQLRRDQIDFTPESDLGDKEMMILMQQKKIAALDEANGKLLHELNRLGEKLGDKKDYKIVLPSSSSSSAAGAAGTTIVTTTSTSSKSPKGVVTVTTNAQPAAKAGEASASGASNSSQQQSQDTPKSVDELLDSLHSTTI